jgi:hypothetical protein
MSNAFKDWTPEMVSIHNMRVRAKKGLPMISTPLNIKTIAPKKRELMNQTEKLWFAELQRRGHKIILCQAITLRLGDRMTYRPDFVTVDVRIPFSFNGPNAVALTCWETKGQHRFRQAGINKLKSAAAMYPWISFRLVERNGGNWIERTIGR